MKCYEIEKKKNIIFVTNMFANNKRSMTMDVFSAKLESFSHYVSGNMTNLYEQVRQHREQSDKCVQGKAQASLHNGKCHTATVFALWRNAFIFKLNKHFY